MRYRYIPAFLMIISFIAIISAGLTQADVIRVPAHQPTIQAGIDAAVTGDTVLVADGVFTGPGNRDIDFLGKAITVRSEHGPDNCIIDCQGAENKQHRGFIFQSSEGRDSILQGFTIRGGDMGVWGYGGGVECISSSPSILDNLITANRAYYGAGIDVQGGSPLIAGNRILSNVAKDYDGSYGAGGGINAGGSTEIYGNIISDNVSGVVGGGIMLMGCDSAQLVNNLITGNLVDMLNSTTVAPGGGGVSCFSSSVFIVNCTITGNRCEVPEYYYSYGGGVCVEPPSWKPNQPPSTVEVVNSIITGNEADNGSQCYVGSTFSGPCNLVLDYSDVEGGETAVYIESGILDWGAGMIDADPLFTPGPLSDWYLGQIAAGQAADSPCLDTGGDPAGLICYDDGGGTVCLDQLTTRSDRGLDAGLVDMGYHYPTAGSVSARIFCMPSSGTLPFSTTMEVSLANEFMTQIRRFAGRIDIQLANGGLVSNWRAGYTNVHGGESCVSSWNQQIPALPSLVGDNIFTVLAMDVTSAPYNQPPYPPAGDSSSDSCTVTGLKP